MLKRVVIMPRLEQPTKAYLVRHETISDDALRKITQYLSVKDLANLSGTCFRLSQLFQPDLYKVAGRLLWQSVIDDDRELIIKILKCYPSLLCATTQKILTNSEMPKGIQSQLTWQIFDIRDETPLSFAIKRNQVKVVELIVKAIENTGNQLTAEQRQTIMQQWENTKVSLTSVSQKAPAAAEETGAWKLTPQQRSAQFYFQSLTAVIKQEKFLNGLDGPLSEATEIALETFRQTVLPKDPVLLDAYYDVEQLLIHAYQAYVVNFKQFQNWEQRDLFCVKVIGYIQSLLPPEVARVFCENVSCMVTGKLQLWDSKYFYRPGVNVSVGLGFTFLFNGTGLEFIQYLWPAIDFLQHHVTQKTTELGKLKACLQDCLRLHDVQQPEIYHPSSRFIFYV